MDESLVAKEAPPDGQVYPGLLVDGIFRVTEEIGRGAHGTVFKASDELLHRDVALKVVNDAILANNPSVQKRFQKETKVLCTLNHQNVVRIFRSGLLPDNSPYIVMEYLEGSTLSALLKEQKNLNLQATLQIAFATASGLEHIHACKVIHSDLKPENVMVNDRNYGQSKIFDFGISRILSIDGSKHDTTTRASIRGTCAYMSPEQAKGEDIDERTDIYAFGCLLFELLTRETAFQAESQAAVLQKHLHEAAPRLASPASAEQKTIELTEKLNQLIALCLEKDPTKRYKSFAELIDDLNQAIQMEQNLLEKTISFRANRANSRVLPGKSQKTRTLATIALLLLIVSAAFGYFQYFAQFQDDYYLTKVEPRKAIPYFSEKVEGLLKEGKTEKATQLVERSTNRFENTTWSKDDHRALLQSYFLIYKGRNQSDQGVNAETYKIALQLFSDLLSWGQGWHRKNKGSAPDDFQDSLKEVATYLLKETNTKARWEQIAALMSKHTRSFPQQTTPYYKTASLLRFAAEEHCPNKCGDDADLLGEHCISLFREVINQPGGAVSVEEVKNLMERVIPLMKKRAQAKDLNLLRCELALFYLHENESELAEEQRKELRGSGLFFGWRTDEIYPYLNMESTFGISYCTKKMKTNALKQLELVEDAIQSRGWSKIYDLFIRIPPENKSSESFSYKLSGKQVEWNQEEPAYYYGYRLRYAIAETFGKGCLPKFVATATSHSGSNH